MSIKVNIKIFAFALLFYLTKQIQIYAMFMIFAVVHELAHLICGILLGLKPRMLKLMPLGFCVEFRTELNDYNNKAKSLEKLAIKKIIIALAGPLVNLCIAILLCFISWDLSNVIYCNLLIAIFNLLPIYPLDGGRIVKNILKIQKGKKKAIECTYIISNLMVVIITAVSSIAIYYYKNVAILLIVAYLWIMLLKENRKYKISNKAYKVLEMSKKLNV